MDKAALQQSAERLSRVFFVFTDCIFTQLQAKNGEKNIQLHSIILHETQSSYAQCFVQATYNPNMIVINLKEL